MHAGTREIKALKVKCTNVDSGCQWIDELQLMEEHLQSCDYKLVQCPNGCMETEGEKITNIRQQNLEDHLTSKCPRRLFKCPHCQESGEYEERVGKHLDTCPGVSVDCPNEDCHKRFPRSNASSHSDICDYTKIPCKYADVGCEEKILRKDLKTHEENNQLHLKATIDTVLKLKQNVAKSINNKGFTFMVPTFSTKRKNDSTYRPSFYSKGYKMSISVLSNGDGDGKGSHVSVYAYIEKGKYDDILIWPLLGTLTIELLNQLEDKNHYQLIITVPADHNQRVVDGAINTGWGIRKYIAHSKLDYTTDKNCQYLKNDALVFRVLVDLPEHKPWLECSKDFNSVYCT